MNDTDYLLAAYVVSAGACCHRLNSKSHRTTTLSLSMDSIAQDTTADVLHSVDQYGLTALMHAAGSRAWSRVPRACSHLHCPAYRNLNACKCLLKNTTVKVSRARPHVRFSDRHRHRLSQLNPKQQSALGNTVLHFAVDGGNKYSLCFVHP